jgi:hypothetical protein
VTRAELEELLGDCPTLYHMAAGGSWPSIRSNGLLSTSALLDALAVPQDERAAIESSRRPESVVFESENFGRVVIRDNKPMDDRGLQRALPTGYAPTDWYHLLNRKVFFWFTRDRLIRLLTAGAYVNEDHDVLEIDARSLVKAHHNAINLSAINSGATKPFPHPRGPETFLPIVDYPYSTWRKKRPRGERAVELTVSPGVVDIAQHTTRVTRMRGEQTLAVIYDSET